MASNLARGDFLARMQLFFCNISSCLRAQALEYVRSVQYVIQSDTQAL